MKEGPDPLGRVDYVDYWEREARLHAAALEWDARRIPEVVRTLELTFGAEWLRGSAPVPSRYPLTSDPRKHPVAHLIASPHRASVMSLIELAVYLRSCANLPGFDKLASILRAAGQFSTGRMQLALAHRFRLAGAEGLELEPGADEGRRADLFFRYAQRAHLVECYEPAAGRYPDFEDLLHGSVCRVMKACKELGRRVVVRVDLKADLDSMALSVRKRIEGSAKSLMRGLSDSDTRVTSECDEFEIEAIDVSGMDDKWAKEVAFGLARRPSWIVAPGQAGRLEVREIPRGAAPKVIHDGWLVVNYKEPDPVERMRRIVEAVESKVSQVRRKADSALGLMAVITDFASLAARRRREALPLVEALRKKILGAHEGLAGIFLVERGMHKESGPFIGGLFIEGREGAHLGSFHTAIARREAGRRVIDDWF